LINRFSIAGFNTRKLGRNILSLSIYIVVVKRYEIMFTSAIIA